MATKILVWLGDEFTYFGMSYFLQNKVDSNLFGIFDTENKNIKQFFKDQKLVSFEKIWSYQENILEFNAQPDIDYLSSFEKKYGINLWSIIYTERYFFPKFNPFYKFSRHELLSIIEKECKFFEKILNEVNPDLFLVTLISRHQKFLLYKMCKTLGIKVLTWESARLRGKWMISQNMARLDNPEHFKQKNSGIIKENGDLITYLKKYQQPMSLNSERKTDKGKKVLSFLKFLNSSVDENLEKSYLSYGKTKSKILTSGSRRLRERKRKEIEAFMDENFIKKPDFLSPYVYFPLHVEPERELLIESPFFSDQLSVIENIAKSLPVQYHLYVKEHPGMKDNGWREKLFYEKILSLSNVVMIHPEIKSHDLIKNSELIINIAGDSSFEAAFYEKPSIVFTKTDYSELSSVFYVDNLRQLPLTIQSALKTKVNLDELQMYVNFLDENSFDFDYISIRSDFNDKIYYPGFLGEIEISEKIIKEFILSHELDFQKLCDENIKKF